MVTSDALHSHCSASSQRGVNRTVINISFSGCSPILSVLIQRPNSGRLSLVLCRRALEAFDRVTCGKKWTKNFDASLWRILNRGFDQRHEKSPNVKSHNKKVLL